MYERIPANAQLNGVLDDRRRFARDEQTPPSTLTMLLFDCDKLTRFEAARNPNINFEILKVALVPKPEFYQACGLAANQKAPGPLLSLEVMQIVEGKHELTPEQELILMLHLLKNSNLPIEALAKINRKVTSELKQKYGSVTSAMITGDEAALLKEMQNALDIRLNQYLELRRGEIKQLENIWNDPTLTL